MPSTTAVISATTAPAATREPGAAQPGPWPTTVVLAIALAGLASPVLTFAGAVVAFALADKEQGTILTGAGLVHMVLGMTFLTGV
jgi:hypothetical protein